MQFVWVEFDGADVPLAATRLSAGTIAFLSGYFIDNSLADPLPTTPSSIKNTTIIAAIVTLVSAALNFAFVSRHNLNSGYLLMVNEKGRFIGYSLVGLFQGSENKSSILN